MLAINLLALAACAWGFITIWRAVRRTRLPLRWEEAWLSWEDNPVPALHYDPLGGLLVAVHTLATMALCLLVLFSVNQAGDSPFSLAFTSPAGKWLAQFVDHQDRPLHWLSLFIAAGSAGIGAYVAGTLLALPFARWRLRPVLMHLHPDGITYGQTSYPWADISAYQVDGSRHLFKLYTQLHRRSPTVVLRPPMEATFRKVERVLRDQLPGRQVEDDPSAFHRRWLPAFLFILAMLLVLLGAFWLYKLVAEWVWFVDTLLILCLLLGSKLLLRI